MRTIWTSRTVNASAETLWSLLSDPSRWHEWGPSISRAEAEAPLGLGVRGSVTTIVGVRLGFEITHWDAGEQWAWKVAGIPATDHRVGKTASGRTKVAFGVPFIAAPYLAVCKLALHRIAAIAELPSQEKYTS